LIAVQRAEAEALAGTLNAQLKPSALRLDLPAANAALVALMQNTRSVAAAISIVNLMAGPSLKIYRDIVLFVSHYITETSVRGFRQIGPVLA
jgi:ABC-type arginine/histidine transport system permease subunit